MTLEQLLDILNRLGQRRELIVRHIVSIVALDLLLFLYLLLLEAVALLSLRLLPGLSGSLRVDLLVSNLILHFLDHEFEAGLRALRLNLKPMEHDDVFETGRQLIDALLFFVVSHALLRLLVLLEVASLVRVDQNVI